jgi:hypothetical protein
MNRISIASVGIVTALLALALGIFHEPVASLCRDLRYAFLEFLMNCGFVVLLAMLAFVTVLGLVALAWLPLVTSHKVSRY